MQAETPHGASTGDRLPALMMAGAIGPNFIFPLAYTREAVL